MAIKYGLVPGSAEHIVRGLLWSLVFLVAACDGGPAGVGESETYRIIEGACGDVVFVENLGPDVASAIEVLEQRKREQFGEGQVRLETYSLAVVDRNGITPQKEFHAVRVMAGDTQFLAHSVVEVVTSGGGLFHLEWCPD